MSTSRITAITGRAIPLRGDDIDTDRIIPARFLRCVTFDGLGEHAFEDDRRGAKNEPHPFDRPEFAGASILVVNRNFGCGSSREHAPQSLRGWGIQAVVGESFAEIFFGNCVALGMPCVTLSGEEITALQERIEADPGTTVRVDVENSAVVVGDASTPAGLPDGTRRALLSGDWDSTRLLLDRPEEIDAVANALPYVRDWGC